MRTTDVHVPDTSPKPLQRFCSTYYHYINCFIIVLKAKILLSKVVFVLYQPILYDVVLWPGVKTSIFGGLTVLSHYHQVCTRLHAVLDVYVVIETHLYRVIIVSVGRSVCCAPVELHFEGKITISLYNGQKNKDKTLTTCYSDKDIWDEKRKFKEWNFQCLCKNKIERFRKAYAIYCRPK